MSRELHRDIDADGETVSQSSLGNPDDRQELRGHMEECLTTLASNAMRSQKTLTWVLKKMVGRLIDKKVLKEEKDPQRHGSKYYVSTS